MFVIQVWDSQSKRWVNAVITDDYKYYSQMMNQYAADSSHIQGVTYRSTS